MRPVLQVAQGESTDRDEERGHTDPTTKVQKIRKVPKKVGTLGQ